MTERKVVVIGAGVMGSGIAQTLATAGCSVVCTDLSREQLERAATRVVSGRYGFDRGVERGKLSEDEAAAAQHRLTFSTDLSAALAGASVVVEAVPEQLALKVELFGELGRRADPGTVLASNTSGFPIAALAAASGRAPLVLGWHWASPAPVQRLAEIAVTPVTDASAIAVVTDLARACGKNPVVVRENPQVWGFVANRVLMAALREARTIVDEGLASRADVDALLRDAYGWPAGLFAMMEGAAEGWGDGGDSSIRHTMASPTGS